MNLFPDVGALACAYQGTYEPAPQRAAQRRARDDLRPIFDERILAALLNQHGDAQCQSDGTANECTALEAPANVGDPAPADVQPRDFGSRDGYQSRLGEDVERVVAAPDYVAHGPAGLARLLNPNA